MNIDGLHEKNLFTEKYPFRIAANTQENFNYPLHWHPAVELVYVLENSYSVNLNNTEIFLEEKDILFIADGDIHSFNVPNKKGKRFFIQFDISRLESFGDLSGLKRYLGSSRMISPSVNPELHKALEDQILAISNEYAEKALAYDVFINARVYDILVLLSRSFINEALAPDKSIKSRIPGLDKLNRALKFIEDNYNEDITLEDAAKAAGFSKFHFSRVFKEITEENFHDYLNKLRVKKAEKLLTDSSMTVAQAAYGSGFNSIATFNRLFRKIRGCSPAEYRKMQI